MQAWNQIVWQDVAGYNDARQLNQGKAAAQSILDNLDKAFSSDAKPAKCRTLSGNRRGRRWSSKRT